MEIRACIFDLDGVITDTARHHFASWNKIAAKLGFELTEWHNEQLKGVSRTESLERILNWAGQQISNEEKKSMLELKNDYYLHGIQNLSATDVLPGIHSFLAELKRKSIKTAIGSSSKNARLILGKIGLGEAFEVISDGNSVARTKPHPDVFEHAAQLLNEDPAYCVVFEDAPSGVDAALAAGMRVVGVGDAKTLDKAHICLISLEGVSLQFLQNQLQ